jgi:hypothetical protein
MPVILPTSSVFGSGTIRLGTVDRWAVCCGSNAGIRELISNPIPTITVATRYATGQSEENQPSVPGRAVGTMLLRKGRLVLGEIIETASSSSAAAAGCDART